MKLRALMMLALVLGGSSLAQAHGGIDGDAVVGGALGGAAGAAVGSAIGGRDVAILGGALGAAAGVSMNTSRPRYDDGWRRGPVYYEDRHDYGRHRGFYKHHHHHGDD